jgi:hypothetical protein
MIGCDEVMYRNTWGYELLTMRSGLKTPIAEIPTPDLAVPYAAPKQVKTIAEVQPIAPKKGYRETSVYHSLLCGPGLAGGNCVKGRSDSGEIEMWGVAGRACIPHRLDWREIQVS